MGVLVYAICCGVGVVFALVSAVLGHLFGGGHDVPHGDVGTGGHAEAGFQDAGIPGPSPFSPTTITTFITAFGAFGLLFSSIPATRSPWISAPLSAFTALVVAAGVMFLFAFIFHKTQSSSESRVGTLVGITATVITSIPAQGVGEIAYVQNGTRYSAPARDERGALVATGQTVKIVRVVGSQFYVAPV